MLSPGKQLHAQNVTPAPAVHKVHVDCNQLPLKDGNRYSSCVWSAGGCSKLSTLNPFFVVVVFKLFLLPVTVLAAFSIH